MIGKQCSLQLFGIHLKNLGGSDSESEDAWTWMVRSKESDLEGIEKYGAVILRRPVQNLDRLKLLKGNRYVAFHADTLIYWTWIDDGRELLCEDVSIKRSSDLYKLELLVRDVFESYENHYFSNPVFQTDLVLSGYVEWAQRNCSTVGSYILLSEPSDEEVGFATVAWNEDVPNVELAGIRSNMRGKGHYRNSMLAIMQETRIAENLRFKYLRR